MYRVVSNSLATGAATIRALQYAEQHILELEDALQFVATREVMDGVTAICMQAIAKASLANLRRNQCPS